MKLDLRVLNTFRSPRRPASPSDLPSVRQSVSPLVHQSANQSVSQSVKMLAFRLIFLKFEVLGIVMF